MIDLYQEIILEEFKHPQNQGALPAPDLELSQRNSSCGDTVVVQLQLADPTQPLTSKITDLKWQGVGCAISMATMSVLSAQILQQELSISQVQALTQQDLESWLGLDEIATGRVKCLLLGLSAFSAQIQ